MQKEAGGVLEKKAGGRERDEFNGDMGIGAMGRCSPLLLHTGLQSWETAQLPYLLSTCSSSSFHLPPEYDWWLRAFLRFAAAVLLKVRCLHGWRAYTARQRSLPRLSATPADAARRFRAFIHAIRRRFDCQDDYLCRHHFASAMRTAPRLCGDAAAMMLCRAQSAYEFLRRARRAYAHMLLMLQEAACCHQYGNAKRASASPRRVASTPASPLYQHSAGHSRRRHDASVCCQNISPASLVTGHVVPSQMWWGNSKNGRIYLVATPPSLPTPSLISHAPHLPADNAPFDFHCRSINAGITEWFTAMTTTLREGWGPRVEGRGSGKGEAEVAGGR